MSTGDVFRALADPTRRALLDALAARDGQTVVALCACAPQLTRFAVMKHLRVLAEADLVLPERVGRETRHFLNPVPLERVAHRWVSRYAHPFATGLLALETEALQTGATAPPAPESPSARPDPERNPVPDVRHVHQIFVAATPERVWAAITESAWTRRYFHGTAFASPLVAGRPYAMVRPDGQPAVEGTVEELVPPRAGEPGRLVQTWHVRYDEALAAEPSSRVEWTLTEAGPGLTRVRLVHRDLAAAPLTEQDVAEGWVWVLDNLKTLLETGEPMPGRTPHARAAAV